MALLRTCAPHTIACLKPLMQDTMPLLVSALPDTTMIPCVALCLSAYAKPVLPNLKQHHCAPGQMVALEAKVELAV